MKPKHGKFNPFNAIMIINIIVLTLLLHPYEANAKADWFQKAKELLRMGSKSNAAQDILRMDEIVAGLKEALSVGTATVTSRLGTSDGFNADPTIHIPLPEKLNTVKNALSKIGMSSMLDDLELRLNRAAESAVPKTKELFIQSIKEMTLEDAKGIYKGPDDAATRYFQTKMSEPIAETMRPIVERSLSEVGALQAYDTVIGKYRAIPFVPDVSADLTNYVINKGMGGIFHYLAAEEAAIRQNPAKRTTDLLKRVFSAASQ